jgi:hypothetical protein
MSATTNESSKRPDQILADAAAALRAAYGYAMQATAIQSGQRLQIRLVTTSATSLELLLAANGSTVGLITLPNASYIRGNGSFRTAHGAPDAARLADRWLQVPFSNARSVASSLGPLAPATLPRCLVEDHGTLSLAGRATVDGRMAILLTDVGDAPGSSAGVLAIAATGPPYPLRLTSTGQSRPGGPIDVCNDGRPSNAHGTITFSQFGHVPPIRPPAHAEQPNSTLST